MKENKTPLWQIALIAIGVLMLFGILYLPVHYYIKYFSGSSPSTKPSDWGPFGDFFGGILNPIISFYSLLVTIYIAFYIKQIEDRRSDRAIESTYKPDLIIEERHFHIVSNSTNTIPIEFSYERLDPTYLSSNLAIKNFHLILLNIGLGPAKKVEITYDIDLNKISKLVNEYAKETGSNDNITVEYNPKYPDMFEFNRNIGGITEKSRNFFEVQNKIKLNHILSINHSTDPYHINIPYNILEAYSALIFNRWNIPGGAKSDLSFPAFSIDIKYLDIGNKQFRKKLEVTMEYAGGTRTWSMNQIEINDFDISRNNNSGAINDSGASISN